jgi:hypothetical protein
MRGVRASLPIRSWPLEWAGRADDLHHQPGDICFNRGGMAQGPPEDVFTPDTLRVTYGSEMLVIQQHGFTLTTNSPLVYRGFHSNRQD